MILLLYGLGLLVVLGTIVATAAAMTARRGFEDELGFHSQGSDEREQVTDSRASKRFGSDRAHLPPLLPTI